MVDSCGAGRSAPAPIDPKEAAVKATEAREEAYASAFGGEPVTEDVLQRFDRDGNGSLELMEKLEYMETAGIEAAATTDGDRRMSFAELVGACGQDFAARAFEVLGLTPREHLCAKQIREVSLARTMEVADADEETIRGILGEPAAQEFIDRWGSYVPPGSDVGPPGEQPSPVDGATIARIEQWILDNGLNQYGDPPGTLYMGGTPLFDESTGEYTDRYVYILQHHPELAADGESPEGNGSSAVF
jgi:hypothetical protein